MTCNARVSTGVGTAARARAGRLSPVKRRFLAPAARATVGAAAVALLASGCAVFSPVTTNLQYDPADGVPATVGDLALRDLVLVGGDGEAVVSGSAVNLGHETLTVQFTAIATDQQTEPAGGSEITLKPREQVDLATKGLVLQGVTAKPGSIAGLGITSRTGGAVVVNVPVLRAVGAYATVTPTVPAP